MQGVRRAGQVTLLQRHLGPNQLREDLRLVHGGVDVVCAERDGDLRRADGDHHRNHDEHGICWRASHDLGDDHGRFASGAGYAGAQAHDAAPGPAGAPADAASGHAGAQADAGPLGTSPSRAHGQADAAPLGAGPRRAEAGPSRANAQAGTAQAGTAPLGAGPCGARAQADAAPRGSGPGRASTGA